MTKHVEQYRAFYIFSVGDMAWFLFLAKLVRTNQKVTEASSDKDLKCVARIQVVSLLINQWENKVIFVSRNIVSAKFLCKTSCIIPVCVRCVGPYVEHLWLCSSQQPTSASYFLWFLRSTFRLHTTPCFFLKQHFQLSAKMSILTLEQSLHVKSFHTPWWFYFCLMQQHEVIWFICLGNHQLVITINEIIQNSCIHLSNSTW